MATQPRVWTLTFAGLLFAAPPVGAAAFSHAAPADTAPPSREVDRTATIYGTITAEGTPVPYAQVGVRGTAVRVMADQMGAYAVTGLPEGAYTLLVSALGYGTTEAEVSVSSSRLAVTRMRVTLVPTYMVARSYCSFAFSMPRRLRS